MAIVLASQSPRRQELLTSIGVEDFKTLSLDIDESYPEGLSPEDTVRYLSLIHISRISLNQSSGHLAFSGRVPNISRPRTPR